MSPRGVAKRVLPWLRACYKEKWYATAGTRFTKPGTHSYDDPSTMEGAEEQLVPKLSHAVLRDALSSLLPSFLTFDTLRISWGCGESSFSRHRLYRQAIYHIQMLRGGLDKCAAIPTCILSVDRYCTTPASFPTCRCRMRNRRGFRGSEVAGLGRGGGVVSRRVLWWS